MVRRFRWLGEDRIDRGADLRACGWHMTGAEPAERSAGLYDQSDHGVHAIGPPDCPLLITCGALNGGGWSALFGNGSSAVRLRRWTLVLQVPDSIERARLLSLGFGDVVGPDAMLGEIEQRALRIAETANSLARYRSHGGLRLDLLFRDGLVAGKALGLHPREFALLWRLMETPGETVEKAELLREVWRLSFVPETNSMAVHVSRLRAKLARAGLQGWVETGVGGGYLLVPLPGAPRQFGRLVGRAGGLLRHRVGAE